MAWTIEEVNVNVGEPTTVTSMTAVFLVFNDETKELVEYEVTLKEYAYYSDSFPYQHIEYEWDEPPYKEMQEVTGLTPQQILDMIRKKIA